MLKIAAIIPVKTFAKAKSRLDVPQEAREALCRLMLQEVLQTLAASPLLAEVIVITGDSEAAGIAADSGASVICDGAESGVNDAVSLADAHVARNNTSASVVLPQDIPFAKVQDVEFLLKNQIPPNFVTIVPSRKFDGTNALVRMPHNIMGTCYDNDSYRAHARMARACTANPSILFVDRIMMDIDDAGDLEHALNAGEKPDLCRQIRNIV